MTGPGLAPDASPPVAPRELPRGVPHEAPREARHRTRRGMGLVRGGLAVLFWAAAQAVVWIPPAPVGAALGALVGVGFLWWYVGRRGYPGERRRRATLRLRPPGPLLAWVPVVLLLGVAFTGAALLLVARVLPLPSSAQFEYFLRAPYGWLALGVLAVWLAPMMEEFVFRGWMQRGLERRMPARWAILVTAGAFAAVHLDAFGLPSRFMVGVASGYLAYLSGSIVPSVLLHAGYNAALLATDLIPGNLEDADLVRLARVPQVLAGAAVVAVASAAGLALTLRRAAGRARPPARAPR